jgi:hemoglobin
MRDTLYELAGGETGIYDLASAFYKRVFDDPVMVPLFVNPDDDHVGRMALWLGEFFGGPSKHTEERGGFSTVAGVHGGLKISNIQREHWIEHMTAACEEVNMADEVMDFFMPHIHFGAQAAQYHSRF